jgi:hypothetical protein
MWQGGWWLEAGGAAARAGQRSAQQTLASAAPGLQLSTRQLAFRSHHPPTSHSGRQLTGNGHIAAGVVPRGQADGLAGLQDDVGGVANDALAQGILQGGFKAGRRAGGRIGEGGRAQTLMVGSGAAAAGHGGADPHVPPQTTPAHPGRR